MSAFIVRCCFFATSSGCSLGRLVKFARKPLPTLLSQTSHMKISAGEASQKEAPLSIYLRSQETYQMVKKQTLGKVAAVGFGAAVASIYAGTRTIGRCRRN